ncbi:MAG TPA: imidazolonepropionase [Longilinea sp.]|nr:imidazolonepropionase [Longilinea sp.]
MTLLHHISQLLTLTELPQRGSDLGTLNILEDGAVLIQDGLIRAVGPAEKLLTQYPNEERLDCGGNAALPGLVDPHTHLVFAGERANEFDLRLQGKTYMEIMAAGGGIASTVKATRQASTEDLLAQTRRRANGVFAHGVTTAEAKSGYGLEWESERRQLETLLALDAEGPLEIAPTFLGAHAIAPEYAQDPDGFTDLIAKRMLADLKTWWTGEVTKPLPFVDVFCEKGAFTLEQTGRILSAAKSMGFPLKVHVDEFENLGGASLAASLGAASADHLVKTSAEDITALANSQTVAVALPCTPFGLADPHYTPARQIIQAGGLLAIASDLNPGTAWCENMQFVIALACRYLRLTPAEAIAAATINAAAAIQRADRIGSITPGKQADLIILNVPDYRHLAYRFGGNLVSTVIKKGIPYQN